MVKEIEGGVTAAQGFRAVGIHAAIKKRKKDLAIVVSDQPAVVAGVFTKNKVVAAPLVVDKAQLEKSPRARAIVVNSGNANACTGERGMNDAWCMVNTAAKALGVPAGEVLVSSTGVIGQTLPMDNVVSGINTAAPLLSREGHADAAEAIMTTDTFVKEAAVDGEPCRRRCGHRRDGQGIRHDRAEYGYHAGVCDHRRAREPCGHAGGLAPGRGPLVQPHLGGRRYEHQ